MSMENMTLSQLGGGKWLKYDDIAGETAVVPIERFDGVQVKDKDTQELSIVNVVVLGGEADGKQLELKPSIRDGLAAAFGGNTPLGKMVGQNIEVFKTTDRFGGKTYNVLRLRKPGGGQGADPFAGPATLGERAEASLMKALADGGLIVENLRKHLVKCDPPNGALYHGQPRNWPRSCAEAAKAWIDAEKAPSGDEIPF